MENRVAVVVERSASGHRLNYVRIVAEQALAIGMRVHVLLPMSAAGHANVLLHLSGLLDSIRYIAEPLSMRAVARHTRELGSDVTVIPDADRDLLRLLSKGGWHGHGVLSMLVMRAPRYETSRRRRIIKALVVRACGAMPGVRVLSLVSSVQPAPASREVRDPADSMAVSMDAASLVSKDVEVLTRQDAVGRYLLVIGAITRRKNVPLVLHGVKDLAEPGVGCVIAGPVAPEVASEVAAAAEQARELGITVTILDRPLNESDFDALLTAAAAVVVAHSNNGPSGVLARAAFVGTRIAAVGAPSLRTDCAQIGLGAKWAPVEPGALGPVLRQLLADPPPRPTSLGTSVEFGRVLLQRSAG